MSKTLKTTNGAATAGAVKNLKLAAAFSFSDGKYMTAEDKAKTLAAWERLLVARINATPAELGTCAFADKALTGRVYDYLSTYCGYIAHYNKLGFFQARIAGTADFWDLIGQVYEPTAWHRPCEAHELGNLPDAMSEIAGRYMDAAAAKVRRETEDHNASVVAAARRILEGNGYTLSTAA